MAARHLAPCNIVYREHLINIEIHRDLPYEP